MERNKAIVRRAIEEIYNSNSLAVVNEIYAPDYIFHRTFGPQVYGPEGVKELVNRRRAVLPNATITIEDQIADANKVVTRWTVRDPHQRETAGHPPDGDQVTAAGILIDRIAGDKIQESWAEEGWNIMGIIIGN
jgi:predicted ester cyclase